MCAASRLYPVGLQNTKAWRLQEETGFTNARLLPRQAQVARQMLVPLQEEMSNGQRYYGPGYYSPGENLRLG